MTKGKHAITAANRRAALAALKQQDIAAELAAAKARAKVNDGAAARVDVLVAEVAKLHGQLATDTAPALESMRAKMETAQAVADARFDSLVVVFARVMSHIPDEMAVVEARDVAELRRLGVAGQVIASRMSRQSRRNVDHGRRVAGDEKESIQDNRKSVHDNLDGKGVAWGSEEVMAAEALG